MAMYVSNRRTSLTCEGAQPCARMFMPGPRGRGWRCLLWMTSRSTSTSPFCRRARGRSACCNASFLKRESAILIAARSWRRRTEQADGDF
jgi:hypothetical protein